MMTINEAKRLADDIADDIRRSIERRPNLNHEGWAIRISTVPGMVYISLTSGAALYTFSSRKEWEDQKDMIR